MFKVTSVKRPRVVVDPGGLVTTLKFLNAGSSFDMVYSAPMNRLYMNHTVSGGNAAIYETTYDTSPTWINRSNSSTSNNLPLYAVNATRLEAHPSLQILYNSGGSNQIYRSNLTFTVAHTSRSGYPTDVAPRLTSAATTMFGIGTSLTRASVDGAGAIGTLTTLTQTPSSGYTTRGSAISPDTGSIWILRIKTTTGAQELMLSEYNSTGTAHIRNVQITMPDPTLVTTYDNLAISPGEKFYIEFGRSIKMFDLATGIMTNFAGDSSAAATNTDGVGAAARFTSIGSIRYSAALGVLLVADSGRARTITVP